jgi:hypothetical protein
MLRPLLSRSRCSPSLSSALIQSRVNQAEEAGVRPSLKSSEAEWSCCYCWLERRCS